MLEMSPQINELAAALAMAQGAIGLAAKDAENPFFHSRYMTLGAIRETLRTPLSANGLAYVQAASTDGARVTVETVLLHASGQFIKAALTLAAKDDGPQAIGSTISYGKRYLLAAMTGVVAEEDDDGEAAMGRPAPKRSRPLSTREEERPSSAPSHAETVVPQGSRERPRARRDEQAPLSDAARRKLFATAREHKWSDADLKTLVRDKFGVDSSKELRTGDLDQLLALLRRKAPAPSPAQDEPF
jgi:ERF superfamily